LFSLALFPFALQEMGGPQSLTEGGAWPWIAIAAAVVGMGGLVLYLTIRARLNRHKRDLTLLNDVALIASETLPVEDMLAQALSKTVEEIGGVAGAICLKDGLDTRIAASHRIQPDEAAELLRLIGKDDPLCAGHAVQIVDIRNVAPQRLRQQSVATCVSVPIIHQEQPLGSICIALPNDGRISTSRLDTLCNVGRLLALGIARARWHEEAQRNLALLSALRNANTTVSSTLELRPTLRMLLGHVGQIPGVSGATVTLVDSASRVQTLTEQIGLDCLLEEPGGWAALDHLAEQTLKTRNTTSIARLSDRSDIPALKALTTLNMGTYQGFPLSAGDRIVGVLSVFADSTNGFDGAFHTFLTALAGQAAAAVQSAQLYTKVAEQLRQLQAARELLVQNEKLSLIGELVSGVAHELNNPLTTILGYAQILEEDAEALPMKEDLRQITEAALRSRTIVQGLLSVVRKHEPRREWVDVNQPIREVLQLKAYQLHVDNIAVETDLSGTMPKILADPHQLHQVFLNLVNNAHQAMARTHGRGHLTVKSILNGNDTIRVEVADDGPGIPAGLQERIFEPFFTTKREGTGLGLSIAQGIVHQHGGSIAFDSQQGLGCRFRVDLPVAVAADEVQVPQEEGELPFVPPSHILVVEDEPAVADYISRVLRRLGHSVRTAADGQEALAALAKEKPDAIISDVKMPTMRGDQFLTELRVLYPELVSRLVFITGDVADPRTLSFLEESRLPRLVKPFGADELRRMVARMLR
jgi:signal transduction histidine kinase/CheY-like chemotaxis protein